MDEKTIRFETDDGWLLVQMPFVKRMERFIRITKGKVPFLRFFESITRDYSEASYITKHESNSIWYTKQIANKIIEYNSHFALKNYEHFYIVYKDGHKIKVER